MRILEVVGYDKSWPASYLKEQAVIRQILSKEIINIHHIGSTAVPNLKAKPVIDILLEVNDVKSLDKYDKDMKQIGYIPKGEFGISGRRFYLKGKINRTHHIHAFTKNSFEAKRHLAFRDYLIANCNIAYEYGQLKEKNALLCNINIEMYCSLKNDFIKYHEKLALGWWNNNRKNI
ncbi:MAG TPA: GrpB family protein [Victivallales bacterium]|nr:GrpB family protein [Victivallales bacterium]